ncbi:MAG: ATP-dependent DNA helicase [Halodesulfurarchaeum sp.]
MVPEHDRFFPKSSPYENQAEAMEEIATALEAGRDVLFEGACGTGKTLAALAPALAHARQHDKTVVITTNVHQQMRQFVEEAREINDQTPIQSVVFKGKASMCHVDVGYEECQVLRDSTRDLVSTESDLQELQQRERRLLEEAKNGSEEAATKRQAVLEEIEALESELEDLEEGNTCEHFYNNLHRSDDEFFRWLFDDVRRPDEIYQYAEQRGLCGYELLKEGLEDVDLVVANYHHLLDPGIRSQFFRWLGKDPDEVITVFDEAHNVEDAARDHASKTLSERTIDSARSELEELDDPRSEAAYRVLDAFGEALVEVYESAFEFGERERIGTGWEDVPVVNEGSRDDLTLRFLDRYTGPGIESDLESALRLGVELDSEYEEAYRSGDATRRADCPTLDAASFVDAYLEDATDFDQYPTLAVRRDEGTDTVYGRAELYTCIPRQVTEELFDSVHASVLMSATLRPFDVLSDVLGLEDPKTLAYGLSFPEENRRTYAVDVPPLFASSRDDEDVTDVVADTLADVIRFTPGNALLFFPSYAEAERYHGLLADRVSATRYLDEPGVPVEDLRIEFVKDDDGAMFTSLWGTLAEGVSFDGDAARTVAVVGVPYPHLDERTEAIQEAYDHAFGDLATDAGWRYAIEIPTVRKTRQAIGRVLRSPEDVGVRALIDRRYTAESRTSMPRYSVNTTFPPEERSELLDIDPEKVKYAMLNFYRDVGAWEREPPTP